MLRWCTGGVIGGSGVLFILLRSNTATSGRLPRTQISQSAQPRSFLRHDRPQVIIGSLAGVHIRHSHGVGVKGEKLWIPATADIDEEGEDMQTDGILIFLPNYMYVCVVVGGGGGGQSKGGRCGGCGKKESGEGGQKRHLNLGWEKSIKYTPRNGELEMIAPF